MEVMKNKDDYKIKNPYSYGIVYIYTIPLKSHKGRVKIGYTTITETIKKPTQDEINKTAKERIEKQTQTSDTPYTFEYATISLTNSGNYFSDDEVHQVLIRSGFPRKSENHKNKRAEWFEINIEIAKAAINAVKEDRGALNTKEKKLKSVKFEFRPNQLEAIKETRKAIERKAKIFLWDAKMRFGKTSAAMGLVKELGMEKILIITHRPSVREDWYDDFKKIFNNTDYQYASKDKGEKISILIKNRNPFIYFASLQDLRLSKRVVEDGISGSKAKGFDKNNEIFDTYWDILIIDEAHEGTQSQLAEATIPKIQTNFTLELSGTPFNILHKHEEKDIYTWDYVMEQEAKLNWDKLNSGMPNPYIDLPALSIYTYDINKFSTNPKELETFVSPVDGAFKFHEFFRVFKDEDNNDTNKFVYEKTIKKFLDLLVNDKLDTKFPYASQEYRDYNKHSLWLLPNRVKVIEAMENLLKEHPIFGKFGIINISGNNSDYEDKDAKSRVEKTIKKYSHTITLTGQRLTTGVSIPEWTAVFMMSDTSSPITYLQTAFRCQTPFKFKGGIKTNGYVFDFSPDRTLKLIAETVELSHKSGSTNSTEQKERMEKFLNFCPIISSSEGKMKLYDVNRMLTELKRAIIDRVSRNGFDDPKLYNDELLKLDDMDIAKFNDLKNIVGASTKERINEIKINNLGMDEIERERAKEAERKKANERTEEEKELLKKLKEEREQKRKAINILRGISIRMPMLVYGADVSFRGEISLNKFMELVDDKSWEEFMPQGLTKGKFQDFVKYYDEDVFKAVAKNIRERVHECDNLLPTERIRAIAEIFSTFKNPDKETVLTPWNVVNLHITETLGGYDFSSGIIDHKNNKPEYKSKDVPAEIWSKEDTKVLEINSKSGLYPLLATYNIYERELVKNKFIEDKVYNELWKKVLKSNIYVICKSPMAKTIAERTLVGYKKNIKLNIIYIEDFIDKLQKKDNYLGYNVLEDLQKRFNITKDMKFTAVVGNPPYQGDNHQQIYPFFYLAARKIGEYVSLIFPTGWQEPKNANNLSLLNNKDIKQDKQIIKIDNRQNVFPGISGAEWTNIILWEKDYDNGLDGKQKIYTNGKNPKIILLPSDKTTKDKPEEIKNLAKLVESYSNFVSVKNLVSSRKPYGLPTDFLDNQKKYKLPNVDDNKKSDNDITIYGLKNRTQVKRYIPSNYLIPRKTKSLNKYKIFIPYAWGNWSKNYLGGAYSDIILAKPNEICTETFLEYGDFETFDLAKKASKYLMTKFLRALLFLNKFSQHSTISWDAIPTQNFSEKWWDKSVAEIDIELMKKYKIPKKIQDFVFKNIQTKTTDNIINYEK